MRDAILAVCAMGDMAEVQASVPFSRVFSKTLRVARAAAGLDEAIGQNKDGIPVVQSGSAIIPSPFFATNPNFYFCHGAFLYSPF
ncbi:MAG: hypothetical protein ACLFQY_22345, partial [Desulfococcaceae bacterium]